MDSVVISEYDWLLRLDSMGADTIRGIRYLQASYRVDASETKLGVEYLLLRRK